MELPVTFWLAILGWLLLWLVGAASFLLIAASRRRRQEYEMALLRRAQRRAQRVRLRYNNAL